MKTKQIALLVFVLIGLRTLAQIVNIPDPNFKYALVNLNVVDTDGNGVTDDDVDTNNDGEIQVTEAEAVLHLGTFPLNINSVEGLESFINLTFLEIHFNFISEIDVSTMPNLRELLVGSNQLNSLNISQNPLLEKLFCDGNNLTALDTSQNILLEIIYCSQNQITDLDFSQNPILIELYCSGNNLTTLNITQNTNLEELNCGSNLLTTIDFTQNVNLINLNCSGNLMNQIDVTQNVNLINLDCNTNLLNEIDVSQNLVLEFLHCGANQLITIDVSDILTLKALTCQYNLITSIDVSDNLNLFGVRCNNNQLVSLDVDNGTNLANLRSQENPNLLCIQVNDVAYAYAQPCETWSGWCKDETTIYSEDCILGITEQNLQEAIQLYPNPVKDVLQINTENDIAVKRVQVYNVLGKQLLESNNPNQIDVSAFATGLLFVKIETDKGVVVKMVVKE